MFSFAQLFETFRVHKYRKRVACGNAGVGNNGISVTLCPKISSYHVSFVFFTDGMKNYGFIRSFDPCAFAGISIIEFFLVFSRISGYRSKTDRKNCCQKDNRKQQIKKSIFRNCIPFYEFSISMNELINCSPEL